MMVFWILNFLAGAACLVLWPQEWTKIGLFYVFAISIYANWDTDYDAVSASLAALHSQDLLKKQLERETKVDVKI